jgi:NAD(P)-dependent dehydrogenase (short-subunit alcohol dehydrogenase family)
MTLGFETTTDEVLAGVDLGGTLAVVTGASAGLGLETARALASAGAQVVLAVRDPARGDAALAMIREQVPTAEVQHGVLDLADLASVRTFGEWFSARFDRLDLLVNNAGVMATPFGRTVDGFELQLGTNHLGHFALTCALLPALLAGAPSRIVVLSSAGHLASDVIWDDPNYETRPYDKWEAYGQAKTANVLFALELDRRYGERGVHAFAVHPGMILTELGRHLSEQDIVDLAARADGALPPMKPVPAGAATSVWAATEPSLDAHGGA